MQFPTSYVDLVRGGETTKHGLHQQRVPPQFETEEKRRKKKMVQEQIKQTVISIEHRHFPSNQATRCDFRENKWG